VKEKRVITVQDDGLITSLGDIGMDDVTVVLKVRASVIVPDSFIKRAWFKLLRRVFGDDGRVAQWTRHWKGPWTVVILSTGQTHTALHREECIRWEEARLTEMEITRV